MHTTYSFDKLQTVYINMQCIPADIIINNIDGDFSAKNTLSPAFGCKQLF